MIGWLKRLATCVSRKIVAITQDYEQVRAGHQVESVLQTSSRMTLAYVFHLMARALANFPFLYPTVADRAETGLVWLSDQFFIPPRQHGRRGVTGQISEA